MSEATETTADEAQIDPSEATEPKAEETPTIDELLAKHDAETQPQQPVNEAPPQQEEQSVAQQYKYDPEIDLMKEFMHVQVQKQTQADINEAISWMQNDHPTLKDKDATLLKGYLTERANTDQRIEKAFLNRDNDPTTWRQLITRVGQDMAEAIGTSVDPQMTSDMESLRASMNTSDVKPTEGPSDTEINGMTDAQFNELKRKRAMA